MAREPLHRAIEPRVAARGIAPIERDFDRPTLDKFRRTEAVNVEGTFLGCREAIRAMKGKGGGSIVNLSSVAGILGDAQSAADCASESSFNTGIELMVDGGLTAQ